MKKLLKGLLFSLLIVAMLFCVSCTEEPEQEQPEVHKHSWGTPVVTKNATCLEKGSQTSTCTVCGQTKTTAIAATGHSFSKQWSYDDTYHWHDSTCVHEGLKSSFEDHTWTSPEILTQQTCTTEGTVRYTCSKCGATKVEVIPPHTFSEKWKSDDTYHWHEATCEHTDQISGKAEHVWGSYVNNGNKTATFTCKDCGKKITIDLPDTILMVMAGPGEDSSNSAVISWHAKAKNSSLEYRKTGDAEWTAVANANCNETLSTADWRDTSGNKLTEAHYRCKVYLEGLSEDTEYEYRIKDSVGDYSEDARFRTAESDTTTFQFMWLSDLHTPKGSSTYINRVRELINAAQGKDGVDLDFVLFTGDMVNKGQIYEHWNYWSDSGLLNDMTYAFVSGNHDYYGWNDKERTTNDFYKEFAAYPANSTTGGKSVLDSSYWFIWNRVLFVCIDNFTTESEKLQNLPGASISDQIAWFKAVVDANEGKYDYLIYCQHLPFFKDENDNGNPVACSYGFYKNWYDVFDEYKVDFALSSDEHTYCRTYALYNDKNPYYSSKSNPDAEKAEMTNGKVSKGTVYVVSNQTEGGSISSLKNELVSGLKYAEYSAGGVGGVYFTVTPTEMTLHLIGAGGKEKDTITVLKKTR